MVKYMLSRIKICIPKIGNKFRDGVKMQVMERREMKTKLRFQEEVSSVFYASVLYENALTFGLKGGCC